MIKKFLVTLFWTVLIILAIKIGISLYRNNPGFILKNLDGQINKTQKIEFKTHRDWLWQPDRTFIFDVIYMNIFSPGEAKMHIKEATRSILVLEALLEPNNFFKKIYDAKMVLSCGVEKSKKLPLWYREESFSPEGKRLKEITFNIKENIAERGGVKFRIPDYTYDPLSVFFNFLNNEFKIGEPIILNLISKEDIYEFKAVPKEVKDGIYKLEGEVFRKNRSSAHGARFTIWVLDGKVRVPLMVKVVSAGGPVYLRLKTVK